MTDAPQLSIRDVMDQVRNLLTQAHAWYGRNIEPLEKLPEALEGAARILDKELPAGKAELEKLTKVLTDLRASAPDVEAEVAHAKARVQTAQEAARTAEAEATGRIETATRLAEARESQLMLDGEYKGAAMERTYTEQALVLDQQIAERERRKKELETAITALKAKFA